MTHTPARRYMPPEIQQTTIEGGFWGPRLQVNRSHTIPHVYTQLLESGRIDAFRPDWNPAPELVARSPWGGSLVMFWDSDVAKWVEAAACSLGSTPDPALEAQLDELIELIVGAQHADGYLNTWFTTVDPEGRWKNLRDWHELYCAGHLIEAAVAYYKATGKTRLLDSMRRYADYIGTVFGSGSGQLPGYCGHPEIELALVRLAEATGEQRYLDLSRYFVNQRGQQPHYYDQEALARGEAPERFWARSYEYNQAHLPVREQTQVVGHAVRAVYLYCAMADLAMRDGDSSLMQSCERLWEHLTSTRSYVMGGIGTSRQNEGFTADYDLPNESAYAETCAAIGLVFWAQRMLQNKLDRRYTDMLELALYNAVLSGVSLAGEDFFYDNPLASDGKHHRQAWFACPCCPPNLARILASLGQYAYASNQNEIAIHLYIQGSARFTIAGHDVVVHQETNYPWDERVMLRVEPAALARFTLALRIPGWCQQPVLKLNNSHVPLTELRDGYAYLEREWQPGDRLELLLPMPAERLYAHPAIKANLGRVALRRGPVIYCLEQVDHQHPITRAMLPADAELHVAPGPDTLPDFPSLRTQAVLLSSQDWQTLYRTSAPQTEAFELCAIPYFAWDNREPGAMLVWIQER